MKKVFSLSIISIIAATAFMQTVFAENISQVADSIIEVRATTIGPFCPKKLVAGDRDFNGRGPEIKASVKLAYSRSAVIATVQFSAKELQGGDNSETNGSSITVLYTAPRGFFIDGIMSGKEASVRYLAGSGTLRFNAGGLAKALNSNAGNSIVDSNDGLVASWEITGDTPGTDISDDDDCTDDTRIKVFLNKLKIKLKKTDAVLGIQTIKLEDITEWLVPNKLARGDREFDGHGPKIKAEVKLRIADGGTKLMADVSFWAQETVHDWSTTEGSWSKLVYEAPYGKKITAILSDKASRTQFISPPEVSSF